MNICDKKFFTIYSVLFVLMLFSIGCLSNVEAWSVKGFAIKFLVGAINLLGYIEGCNDRKPKS